MSSRIMWRDIAEALCDAGLIVILILLLCGIAFGQPTKPYGAFGIEVDCRNIPSWISFSGLPAWTSEADMARAADCSRRTGMQWVLKFGFDQIHGTEKVAKEARMRAQSSGLLPYIVAVQFNEEWYGQAASGIWGPPSYDTYDAVARYGGEQHRILKDVFHLPIVYVDSFINNNRSYGLALYKPLPVGFGPDDVLAIETYVPAGGSWDRDVEPYLKYTIDHTSNRIVLVAQAFRHPPEWNDQWRNGPSQADGLRFKQWLQHPRVIAAWLFTWGDRANGIRGVESMPWVIEWFR